MECKYFGECGSCKVFDMSYSEQLNIKSVELEELFKENYSGEIDIFSSKESNFRSRAEFKIFHQNGVISYAMNGFDKKFVLIESCSIVSNEIAQLMQPLLNYISDIELLKHKLFTIEFLSFKGDILVTLIYHKKLDNEWLKLASDLEKQFNLKIIGRSKRQKVIVSKDYINSKIDILNKEYNYQYIENGFTQPNISINIDMIEWVIENSSSFNGDLIELYCGAGNFTIPLSRYFNRVLATEISKTSIRSAKLNCSLNFADNIDFIRMSSEEFTQALNGVRDFRRLEGIDLNSYDLKTIFIDPPRAGLDPLTIELVKRFDNIIYISCNPQTLYRDLTELTKSHKINRFALFDQFPYTHHIESGVVLSRVN